METGQTLVVDATLGEVECFFQMSEERLKALLDKIKTDISLKEKLKSAADADAVVAIAKEAGFVVSVEEIKAAQALPQELSDEELEGVAGGGMYGCDYAANAGTH